MNQSEDPTRTQQIDAFEAEASYHRVVAQGMGYPNHRDTVSPNPTGWLNVPGETAIVSRETTNDDSKRS